ncbi:MAG: 2-succinyl-5-enolpyruvyl-6-hydroxy-3-cyclohexene-carboxylic-acid synthase [Actinomycetota bacterium]
MRTPGDTAAAFCATLVDEWVRAGIRHAVVAPGSRSTPLAVAIEARGELALHIFHDERSAAFAALGIGRDSGFPAVLLCTSGTAATHFAAAVHEANLSRVPMVVCTADRPPELRDVGAPQTIDQTKLYGNAVRWFHDPGVPSEDARGSWRSLARRAVAAAVGTLHGPVHLNLPFREPLLGTAGELPRPIDATVSRPYATVDVPEVESFLRSVSGRKGVVVAGRGSDEWVGKFGSMMGWPVLADPASGLRHGFHGTVTAFDPVLRSAKFADSHFPEVVVRVGDPPASKVLAQWVARSGARVVQVSDHPAVVDPDHSVSQVIVGRLGSFVRDLRFVPAQCDDSWSSDWWAASDAADDAIEMALGDGRSEMAVARAVTASCRPGSRLVVSSSMPIRDVEWYGAAMPGVTVHANRGANGIDGVVSTAVGIALSSREHTVLYIGDVAMVHDSNGLWGLARRGVDLTIVVANNDGGSIFSFLPQAGQVGRETFETLYGTPHGVDLSSLAAAHGIPHVRAEDASAVACEVESGGTKIVEFVSDRHANVGLHDKVNAAVVAAVDATLG